MSADKIPVCINQKFDEIADLKERLRGIDIEIGGWMRGLRQRKSVSVRQLAKQLGISAAFLSDMELGKRQYTRKWVAKAWDILEVKK